MEYIMNTKLTQEEIKYIDNYLKFLKVDYIDVRVELVDHLASEFENKSEYVLLEDFLRPKKNFVKSFEKKLHKQKHWAYQRSLFKGILRYFISPKYMVISVGLLMLLNALTFSFSSKIVNHIFIVTLILPQLVHLYMFKKPKDMHRNIQSARYIMSIMSFPTLFFYAAMGNFDEYIQKPIFFIGFWFLAMVSNLAGLEAVAKCKKQVLQHYKQLVD